MSDDMSDEARAIAEDALVLVREDRENDALLARLRQMALTGNPEAVQAWALLRIAKAQERQADAIEEASAVYCGYGEDDDA
jgi:hypothetical protein